MRLAKNPNDTLFLRSASSARLRLLVTAATVCAVFSATGLAAQEFQYDPVGQLIPGSGVGRVDSQVYVPGMRFPVESAPAYANSQVYRPGGNKYDRQLFPNGKGQCDARNFAYPWGDNYCEIRGWTMPRCPAGTGHQGQDIRGSSCADNTHWVVAAEDGVITSIKSISVYLMNNAGTVRHRYLHMDRDRLEVTQGQAVKKGDRIGLMSNWAWHSGDQRRVKHWTTVHLHYDLKADGIYIPTYMSLVKSYEALIDVPEGPPTFTGNVVLMDFNYDGLGDLVQHYGEGTGEDEYLVGDWDGDGRDNIAVRRGNTIIMDFNYDGLGDLVQHYGEGGKEQQYLAGDWDGDGRANIAVRR